MLILQNWSETAESTETAETTVDQSLKLCSSESHCFLTSAFTICSHSVAEIQGMYIQAPDTELLSILLFYVQKFSLI